MPRASRDSGLARLCDRPSSERQRADEQKPPVRTARRIDRRHRGPELPTLPGTQATKRRPAQHRRKGYLDREEVRAKNVRHRAHPDKSFWIAFLDQFSDFALMR